MAVPDPSTFDRIAVPYDRGMAPLEKLWLRQMRSRLVPQARGQVLEIGIGTGANLRFYAPSTCVTAIDESPDMLAVAARRAASLNRCAHLGRMDVEHLAFPNGYFDTVLASLVLCSVLDQRRALDELKRVLKPGGRLLLLEHMRPQARPLAWLADLANKPWYALNGRCHLNRETQRAIVQAGFRLEQVESMAGGLLRLISGRTD
jgi:phosphatidylethanolamine/phosphatidyl-N-methylethanolamine N-methyltransferase